MFFLAEELLFCDPFPSMFTVMRKDCVPPNLLDECNYLIALPTQYIKGEYTVDLAPRQTDCLTAAAWLHRKPERLELDYIANMPRKLAKYQFIAMKVKEMVAGDWVFFANYKGRTRHVGIAVSADHVFHCSKPIGKACIEPISNLLGRVNKDQQHLYYKIDDPFHLLTQIDKRTFITPLFPFVCEKKSKKGEKNKTENQEPIIYMLNYAFNPALLCEASKNALCSFQRDEQNIASIQENSTPPSMDCSNDPEPSVLEYTRPIMLNPEELSAETRTRRPSLSVVVKC